MLQQHKNIATFYLLLLIPMGLAILALKQGYMPGNTFILFMAVYIFLYHPFICGLRLLHNKKISNKDFWKNFIPFWNDKYWVFLFFNK